MSIAEEPNSGEGEAVLVGKRGWHPKVLRTCNQCFASQPTPPISWAYVSGVLDKCAMYRMSL